MESGQQDNLNKQLMDQYVEAGAQETPHEQLCSLSGHFCDKIRAQVAGNPCTPLSVLTMLAKDSCPDVRLEVAVNASSPRGILNQLVHDDEIVMRYELASDIDLPTWMLEALALDKNAWVRDEALKTLAIVAPSHDQAVGPRLQKSGRQCKWSSSGALCMQPFSRAASQANWYPFDPSTAELGDVYAGPARLHMALGK